MEDEKNRSSGAPQEAENENSKPPSEKDGDIRERKIEKKDDQREVSSNSSSDCTVDNSTRERGESRASQSGTLAPAQLSESDFQFDESSQVLSEVPVEYSLQPLPSILEVKDQESGSDKETVKDNTNHIAQVEVQAPDGPNDLVSLDQLPASVTQSISSISSLSLPGQKLQSVSNGKNQSLSEQEKLNSRDTKRKSTLPMLKTPADGYNWRKYGQKQVKSPEGSRSYYRCTYSDCSAKKIEWCDRSNCNTETVYRSHHNHDPPQKIICNRENGPALPIVPVNDSDNTASAVLGPNDLVQATSPREPLRGVDQSPETKQESSGSDETTEINVKEEYLEGPESRRRQKRSSTGEVESVQKPGKKPKFVVHAAGDVGISGDGYRWRKYGQKMVKGNLHPRNYYRCTSAGCPVRKHIERDVDNNNGVVITYKGAHDHDMPVPRKSHATKSAPAVATNSPVPSDNSLIHKSEEHQTEVQWSVDKEDRLPGEASNLGGEKTPESARTLLSIGFEIKPC